MTCVLLGFGKRLRMFSMRMIYKMPFPCLGLYMENMKLAAFGGGDILSQLFRAIQLQDRFASLSHLHLLFNFFSVFCIQDVYTVPCALLLLRHYDEHLWRMENEPGSVVIEEEGNIIMIKAMCKKGQKRRWYRRVLTLTQSASATLI
jgi:hypothetical protein